MSAVENASSNSETEFEQGQYRIIIAFFRVVEAAIGQTSRRR